MVLQEGELSLGVACPWLYPGCVCNSFLHTLRSLQKQYLQVGLWSGQIIQSERLLSLCDLSEEEIARGQENRVGMEWMAESL